MLTRVEKAFRDWKTDLGLRPNYHQLEDRVDEHILISILAYHHGLRSRYWSAHILMPRFNYQLRENQRSICANQESLKVFTKQSTVN